VLLKRYWFQSAKEVKKYIILAFKEVAGRGL
jgi:hypothetical protein